MRRNQLLYTSFSCMLLNVLQNVLSIEKIYRNLQQRHHSYNTWTLISDRILTNTLSAKYFVGSTHFHIARITDMLHSYACLIAYPISYLCLCCLKPSCNVPLIYVISLINFRWKFMILQQTLAYILKFYNLLNLWYFSYVYKKENNFPCLAHLSSGNILRNTENY